MTLRDFHRASAFVIVAFAAMHIANHLASLLGVSTHIAFMETARTVYRHWAIESVLLFCVAFQVASGLWFVIRGWRQRKGLIPWLQAGSGAYLAFFLLIHVGAVLFGRSLTKYIGGHGTTIGGMIIDSGKFDWVANKARFPMLNEPDPSYHGVVYTAALGAAAYIGRCRVVPLRNTGAALAPHSAFLLLQGLETLALRMERHCSNAVTVANYLQSHPQIAWVNYAALANSPHQATCQKITGGHASGILSFGIKGGQAAGAKFIDALQMILRLVNIGDAKSLACHPASTTHRQLSPDELKRAGVSEDMVRISVGIEHIDDIIADIEQALAKAAA